MLANVTRRGANQGKLEWIDIIPQTIAVDLCPIQQQKIGGISGAECAVLFLIRDGQTAIAERCV
jgi:hypothetical protein